MTKKKGELAVSKINVFFLKKNLLSTNYMSFIIGTGKKLMHKKDTVSIFEDL